MFILLFWPSSLRKKIPWSIYEKRFVESRAPYYYTVKNGKFKKILTSEIRTMKLIICNSKICVRSLTTFHFRVTNWDFCGLYRCCFAKEEWRLQKTQYFVGSSLFVAQHYSLSNKHDTSFDAPGGGVAETRNKIKNFRFRVSGIP